MKEIWHCGKAEPFRTVRRQSRIGSWSGIGSAECGGRAARSAGFGIFRPQSPQLVSLMNKHPRKSVVLVIGIALLGAGSNFLQAQRPSSARPPPTNDRPVST